MSDTSVIFSILAIDRASEKILGVNSAFGKLAVGVAAGAAEIGIKTIHMAGDFEKSQEMLVTTAGETQSALKMVSDGVLAMSGKVGVGAQELSRALYTVESAGFHGAEGLKVLEAASKGARIEGADAKEVADAVSSALVDYHMSADHAAEITNTLIAAVGHGKTTMQALSGAMPNVMAAAAAAGVSFGEAASALATMTMHGTDASTAGTYLRQVILGLENPTAKARHVMKSLGLDANEVSQNLGRNGLASTIKMVEDAVQSHLSPAGLVAIDTLKKAHGSVDAFDKVLANLPASQKTAIGALADMVGGVKNLQGFLQLGGENLKVFEANTAAVKDQVARGGKEIDGWSQYQQTFNAKMAEAKATVEALGIKMGTALLPYAKELLDNTMKMVDWFGQHKAIGEALAATIGTLAAGYLTYKTYLLAAKVATDLWKVATVAWTVATRIAVIATNAWSVAQWALNVAFDSNPIGVVILAVAALALGIWYLWTHSSAFRKFFIDMWSHIWGFLKDVGAWFAGPFAGFFTKAWDAIVSGVKGAGTAIHHAWSATINFFTSLPGKIGAALAALPGELWRAFNKGLDMVFYAIGYGIGWIIKQWMEMPGRIWHIITELWDVATTLVATGFNAVVDWFVKLPGRAEAEAKHLWEVVSKAWDDGVNWVTSTVSSLWDTVTTDFSRGVDVIVEWVMKLPGRVEHWFIDTYNKATTWAGNAVDGVVGWFEKLPGRAWDAFSNMVSAIWSAMSGAGDWLYNVGRDIITGLISGVKGAWHWAVDTVKRFMGDILQGAKDAIIAKSPSRKFADEVGKWIPHGIAAGITGHASVAHDAVADLMDGLTSSASATVSGGLTVNGGGGGGMVTLPIGNGSGGGSGNAGNAGWDVRAAPGDQVAELLLSLLRPTVRGRYGGSVTAAMGGAQ